MSLKKISTVFLPKTDFPALPKNIDRARLDSLLASNGDFLNFYQWQKNRANERGRRKGYLHTI